MRAELRLRVMAELKRTRLALTASVGKRPTTLGSRNAAFGYKPKIYGTGSTSGAGIIPDAPTSAITT